MAVVRLQDGQRIVLLDEHMFGRSSSCDTVLSSPGTSSRHALVYWQQDAWWLRDLGSTNGTKVNGAAVLAGQPVQLSRTDQLEFATTQLLLEEDSPPRPSLLCLETGELLAGDETFIHIPEAAEGQASIYASKGAWLLDRSAAGETEPEPLWDGQVFQLAGKSYRFHSAAHNKRTVPGGESPSRLQELALQFEVSLDEEHVSVNGSVGDRSFDLGSRAHNYLLLTLARQRLEDEQHGGLPETAWGWIDAKDLMRQLGSTETKLSVDICRIRQQFAKAGFNDAAEVIERRRGTGQLRIGVSTLTIERI